MPPWTGRFDNALHLPIMRDLREIRQEIS